MSALIVTICIAMAILCLVVSARVLKENSRINKQIDEAFKEQEVAMRKRQQYIESQTHGYKELSSGPRYREYGDLS